MHVRTLFLASTFTSLGLSFDLYGEGFDRYSTHCTCGYSIRRRLAAHGTLSNSGQRPSVASGVGGMDASRSLRCKLLIQETLPSFSEVIWRRSAIHLSSPCLRLTELVFPHAIRGSCLGPSCCTFRAHLRCWQHPFSCRRFWFWVQESSFFDSMHRFRRLFRIFSFHPRRWVRTMRVVPTPRCFWWRGSWTAPGNLAARPAWRRWMDGIGCWARKPRTLPIPPHVHH